MGLETLNNLGVKHPFKAKYDNYIGGKFVPPVDGKYFENISPVTGKVFCEVARSNEKDINLALDAAHAAKDGWAKKSPTERANILMQVADIMEKNLSTIAIAETIDNGKPLLYYRQQYRFFSTAVYSTANNNLRCWNSNHHGLLR